SGRGQRRVDDAPGAVRRPVGQPPSRSARAPSSDRVGCRLVDGPNDVAPASDAGSSPSSAKPKVVVVMPAYNAAQTLERTYADIPHELIDRLLLLHAVSGAEPL